MKLYFKKIIAREFLILIVVIAIGVISFSLTFPYNFYLKSNEKRNISEIEVKSQQLDTLFSSAYKMNEGLIKTLYNRAKRFGYKKSKAEFVNLLHTDQEVFEDMYAWPYSVDKVSYFSYFYSE